MSNAEFIPVASLVIAALAVFVGPLLSWAIGRRTLLLTERMSNRQMLLPVRQAWLAELRSKLAEVLALSLHYWAAGFEDRTDDEYRQLRVLEQEIKLLLDPHDAGHEQLLAAIRDSVAAIGGRGPEGHDRFADAHTRLEQLSRELVHQEWDRVTRLEIAASESVA